MSERILIVDDDPNVLQAFRRQLRKRFDLDTAQGGQEGLAAIARRGPYAVVVSDMRMPGMDGVQFLAKVRQYAADTVRMMITGNADQKTAVDAVNEGHIFRFLNKPCPPETLARALEAGIAQYGLITAERELLSKTLTGSVKVLTDVLSLVNPTAFGRASRVRRLVRRLAEELGAEKGWECELAAMLSQLGCVTIPEATLAKAYRSEPLSSEELRSLGTHSQIASDLIANIPRLRGVARIVASQDQRFDASAPTDHDAHGPEIPLGASILKLALDFDSLLFAGSDNHSALAEIDGREGWYDPAVVEALKRILDVETDQVVRHVALHELADNMILAEDVQTATGTLLMSKGQEVHRSMRLRLLNHARTVGIREPIKILVPAAEGAVGSEERSGLQGQPTGAAAGCRIVPTRNC